MELTPLNLPILPESSEVNELIEKKFENNLPAFIAAFSKSKKLSKTDIDEIKKIIENAGE